MILSCNESLGIDTSTIQWSMPTDLGNDLKVNIMYDINILAKPMSPQNNISATIPANASGLTNTSHTFTGLQPYTVYRVFVSAVNRLRESDASICQFRTLENVPSNEPNWNVNQSRAISTDVISLFWDAPSPPHNGIITRYRIFYTAEGEDVPLNETTSNNQLFYQLTNLKPFTDYSIMISAGTTAGFGPQSATLVIRTLPEPIVISDFPSPTPGEIISNLPDPTVNTFSLLIPDIPLSMGRFSHFWIICGRDFQDNGEGPDAVFPANMASSRTYNNSHDENELYIVAELGTDQVTFPHMYTVGDESITQGQGVTYYNGLLTPNTQYRCFYRFFYAAATGTVSRMKRDPLNDRVYSVFSSTPFITRSTAAPTTPSSNAGAIAGGVIAAVLIVSIIIIVIAILLILYVKRKDKFRPKDSIPLRVYPRAYETVIANNTTESDDIPTIPVSRFPDHVVKLHANKNQLFTEEYQLLTIRSPTLDSDVAKMDYNHTKNRYVNILAADENRVPLEPIDNDPRTDYINANFVDGFNKKNEYIAAQGPLVSTEQDMWRMIWEQGTKLIIMLTNLVEKNRVKCHQYWPEEKATLYGDVKVELESMQKNADMVLRKFKVSKGNETRSLKHLHFLSWPDFGAPEDPFPFLHLVKKFELCYNPQTDPSPIIHCSAGVGRTGTLICVRSMIQMIEDKTEVDIFNYALKMRKKRSYMIQSEKQYVFVHDVLLEYIKSRNHMVKAEALSDHMRQLELVDPATFSTGYQKEFRLLESIEDIDDNLRKNGLEMEHYLRNRYPENIPYDEHSVKLPTTPHHPGSGYYPAVYINGYNHHNQFILAEGPMDATSFDFWRLIFEEKPCAIVMIGPQFENGEEQFATYWPSNEQGLTQTGAYVMETQRELIQPAGNSVREILLTNIKDHESYTFKLFHFPMWPSNGNPKSTEELFKLIGSILKTQRKTEKAPILIHGKSSTGPSAVFCALCIILECLKEEGAVDIFATIRAMRARQPNAVDTNDLYEFIYQASKEYLASFDHVGVH